MNGSGNLRTNKRLLKLSSSQYFLDGFSWNHGVTIFMACLMSISIFNLITELRDPAASLSSSSLAINRQTQPGNTASTNILNNLPIDFIPNKGQFDRNVRYYASGPGYSFHMENDGVSYTWVKKDKSETHKSYSLALKFLNANPSSNIAGIGKKETKANYFFGNDKSKWQTGLSTFGSVKYENLYDGIDLIYKGDQKKIKYEFTVKPGADYRDIKVNYSGAETLRLDKQGNLIVGTPWGDMKDEKPYIYQLSDGKRVMVDGSFVVTGQTVGFAVAGHDPGLPLIIDPGLVYSTFEGGVNLDNESQIAIDDSGNTYVAWRTIYSTFTVNVWISGVLTLKTAYVDAIRVGKLNSSGTGFTYLSSFGGSSFSALPDRMLDDASDYVRAIDVDTSGNIYIAGRTYAPDFPLTSEAYRKTYGHWDSNGDYIAGEGFAVKLTGTGGIVYSTFLDTTSDPQDIAVDGDGAAYFTGKQKDTYLEDDARGDDVFVGMLTPAGDNYAYGSLIGSGEDCGNAIELDDDKNIYIVGTTNSQDFESYTYSSLNGQKDVFIAKLKYYSTNDIIYVQNWVCIGGSKDDIGRDIAIDDTGAIYITGITNSSNYPVTSGSYDTSYNGAYNSFITKVNNSGNIQFSTFFSSSSYDFNGSKHIGLDSNKNIYLSVSAGSGLNLPITSETYDSTFNGLSDVYIAKFNSTGRTLVYSTFFGGSDNDELEDMVVDGNGNVYIAGHSFSSNLPRTSGDGIAGSSDIFIAKLDMTDSTPPSAPIFSAPTYSTNNSPSTGFNLSWYAIDKPGGTGIDSYQIQYRPHTTDNWTTITIYGNNWTNKTKTHFALGKPGFTYDFRARAKDKAGNTSAWSSIKQTVLPFDDTSLKYPAAWSSASPSDAYKKSLKYSNKKGYEASLVFTGKALALIAPRGSNRGKVDAYVRDKINGVWSEYKKVKTIDQYSSVSKTRVAFAIKSWPSSSVHQVKFVVSGTKNTSSSGTRVAIDGIAIRK